MSAEPVKVAFEFDDASARQATREAWLREGRRLLEWRWLIAAGLGTALFVWSASTPTSPTWWLVATGVVPGLVLAIALCWLALLWWLPRRAVAKVQHLPHRHIEVALTADAFALRSATEFFELAWSEVREVRDLPSFVVVRFRSGGEIPLPRDALGEQAERQQRRFASLKPAK